jgi:hypothetical protein
MPESLDNKIYDLFDDEVYLKRYSDIVASYQEIENNADMTREAKDRYKRNAKQLITDLKREKKEKAEELIEEAKNAASFKFPEPPAAEDSQEELLHEIKKSNQISLIREEISSASSTKELIDLARKYEEDPLLAQDVDRLVKAKFKREGEEQAINRLNIERQPNRKAIEKSKHLVNFLTSGDKITEIKKKENGEYDFNWRSADKDLKKGETPNNLGKYKADISKAIKGGE